MEEEKWKKLGIQAVFKCAKEVCGFRMIGQGIRKWWNDLVRSTVIQKSKVF